MTFRLDLSSTMPLVALVTVNPDKVQFEAWLK